MSELDNQLVQFKEVMTLAAQYAHGDENTVVVTPAGNIPTIAKQAKDNQEKVNAVLPDLANRLRIDADGEYTVAQQAQARANLGLELVDNVPDTEKPISRQMVVELQHLVELLSGKVDLDSQNTPNGYPSLQGMRLILRNSANDVTNLLINDTTEARTWTLPNATGQIALLTDIKGTNSGTNTGDETTATIKAKLGDLAISGTNTGDETQDSIIAALGYAPLSPDAIGKRGGLAPLNADGVVAAEFLPNSFNAVEILDNPNAFPVTGVPNRIYIVKTDSTMYYWDGAAYLPISLTSIEKAGIVHTNRAALDLVTGTNTGDETKTGIETKLAGSLTLKSNAPTVIFNEQDQANELGLFRAISDEGALRFDVNTATMRDFSSYATAWSISSIGVSAIQYLQVNPTVQSTGQGLDLILNAQTVAPTGTGSGGSVNIAAGDSSATLANARGGAVNITAGKGAWNAAGATPASKGGTVTITGGVGPNPAAGTSAGGDVVLQGGVSGTGQSSGGDVLLQGGASAGRKGGNVNIRAGTASGENTFGGGVNITATWGTGASPGGNLNLYAGDSPSGQKGKVAISSPGGVTIDTSLTIAGALALTAASGESLTNKATSLIAVVDNVAYPTVQAVRSYVDALFVGTMIDCGNWDASVNTWPTTGGTGAAGAIKKGNFFFVSANGVLGGVAVNVGDSFRALVDAPGQTAGNWDVLESNIGYVPYNATNPLGFTANQTDAYLLSRANHTGTQSADTVLDSASRVMISPAEHAAIAHANRTALDLVSGTNTGDETKTTLESKLAGTLNLVNSEPTITFDENDQAASAGKWRMVVADGLWRLDVNTAAARDFSSYLTPLSVLADGRVNMVTGLRVQPDPNLGGAGTQLYLRSGNGTIAGGSVTLSAGIGTNTNSLGGSLNVAAGFGKGAGAGGNLNLTAGDSPGGTKGKVNIVAPGGAFLDTSLTIAGALALTAITVPDATDLNTLIATGIYLLGATVGAAQNAPSPFPANSNALLIVSNADGWVTQKLTNRSGKTSTRTSSAANNSLVGIAWVTYAASTTGNTFTGNNTYTQYAIDASGGAIALNAGSGFAFKATCTVTTTVSFSGWAAAGVFSSVILEIVNGGAVTLNLPAINWPLPTTGAAAASFAAYLTAIGRTPAALQTAGTDQLMFWSTDGGVTVYGKLIN